MVVSKIFYFHAYLGKWSNLTNIFQMGWNHQLVTYRFLSYSPISWNPTLSESNWINLIQILETVSTIPNVFLEIFLFGSILTDFIHSTLLLHFVLFTNTNMTNMHHGRHLLADDYDFYEDKITPLNHWDARSDMNNSQYTPEVLTAGT